MKKRSEYIEGRAELGVAARKGSPRRSHGSWAAGADRRDPVSILDEQAAGRVQELVPIRYGRMAASPFAFYRGSAAVMSADLATYPSSGLTVQLCGDAHLSNFGLFASPERRLQFGLNDFDETLPGPFEWDLKRLAASFSLFSHETGFSAAARHNALVMLTKSYRDHMTEFATMREIDVWYHRVRASRALDVIGKRMPMNVKHVQRRVSKAYRKDHLRALEKLTATGPKGRKILKAAPLIVPATPDERHTIEANFSEYLTSLPAYRRMLLGRYRIVDIARKVVGVGSVGTRCWMVLLQGRDDRDPLFLQVKEATASVLEPYLGESVFGHHGQRVVVGQRLTQAYSDMFLGWATDTHGHDFYWRQLWDMKGRVEPITEKGMSAYALACAWALACAHAKTGDAVAITAYIGPGSAFIDAIERFADAYAAQAVSDHAELLAAEKSGRIQVIRGL